MIHPLLAQCLHTVTEDNTTAAQQLCGSSDMMKTLEKSLMADGTSSDIVNAESVDCRYIVNKEC